VLALARRSAHPALALLALAYGSTFGGTATPIGTAPNFIGYAEMRKLAPEISFVRWMAVGLPVWLGTTAIGCGVLLAAGKLLGLPRHVRDEEDEKAAAPMADGTGGDATESAATTFGRRAAMAALLAVAAVWLTVGFIKGVNEPGSVVFRWLDRYVPESMPPILAASVLFFIPARGRGAGHHSTHMVLERRDLQRIDWDTLFLIAGGLCLGNVLRESGAAQALADQAATVQVHPFLAMLALGGATLLLSELTSNTATAALMVPIAGALGSALGIPPVKLIMLVALSASLGFALPVSTPPNAIVYGTRQVPLRLMAGVGVVVDALCLLWVVACVAWLA
jgi:sodium-dependent dicarboxylate transporter 2/3/5